MVLVDTSVWISHFREMNAELHRLLYNEKVLSHPYIIGEIACGNIKNRREILNLLDAMPKSRFVHDYEVLLFLESNRLMGMGLGYIDMCLLASAVLTDVHLWTLDKSLRDVSTRFNLQYRPDLPR
ncbi:VapC toxin family PIN domain ribonuclease [bacterium I07]|nr:VapC toxin family PIN domain ribonuclease [bacterium I07]